MYTLLNVLLLASSSVLASPLVERARDAFTTQLFAYGASRDDGIGGLPLIFVDGKVYAGQLLPNDTTTAANITLTWTSADDAAVINTNTSSVVWNSTEYLWIDTADDAFEALQVAPTAPSDDYTNTGFTFYGNTFFWKGSSGIFESLFYATPTNATGLYLIKWNEAEESDGESVPVSIRTLEPSNADSRKEKERI